MDSIIIKPEHNSSKWTIVKQKFSQPKVYIPTVLGLIAIAVAASLINRHLIAGQSAATQSGSNLLQRAFQTEKTETSKLDGLQYAPDIANRHALGVIIENHPESRPQFGLADAAVVYEAKAEGGITRFLAIYGPKAPEKVGPVRSARTYYLDWCLEYDCFLAHVGGNIDALDLIPKIGIKDLDQFRYGTSKYGKTYYRVPKKGVATEHTMYADPAKLYEIANTNSWPMTGGHPSVNFKREAATDERPTSQQIDITISSRQFNTAWTYDPATNTYARTMGGAAHTDGATGEQIKSKVIIIQEAASQPIVTRINEQGLKMTTVGTGKAKIFQDGKATEGTWKKASQKERTIFMDEQGNEIRYNPGQRWITVVEPGSKVTVQ